VISRDIVHLWSEGQNLGQHATGLVTE